MQPLPPNPAPGQALPPIPPPPVATLPAPGARLGDTWSSGGGGTGPRMPKAPSLGGRWKLVAAGLVVILVGAGLYVLTRPKQQAPVAQVQTTALRIAWEAGKTYRFQFEIDPPLPRSVGTTPA